MRTLFSVTVVLSSLVSLSCSPPPIARADAGAFVPTAPDCLAAQRRCDALAECGTDGDRAFNRALFGYLDDADCLATLTVKVDGRCYDIDSSLEAGRVAVDRRRLSACKRALDALSCGAYLAASFNPPAACVGPPLITGRVELGDECTFDEECVSPGVCSDGGVCATLPERGEACLGTRCASGLTCDGTGKCGGSATCLRDTECAASEYCDQPGNDFEVMATMPNLMGTCVAKIAPQAACDDLAACANTCPTSGTRAEGCMHCAKTNGFSSEGYRNPGTCEAAKANGSTCSEGNECLSRNCQCPGAFSCSDGVCT